MEKVSYVTKMYDLPIFLSISNIFTRHKLIKINDSSIMVLFSQIITGRTSGAIHHVEQVLMHTDTDVCSNWASGRVYWLL